MLLAVALVTLLPGQQAPEAANAQSDTSDRGRPFGFGPGVTLTRIPRIQWDSSLPAAKFLAKVRDGRKPVVIEGSPVRDWPAVARWANDSYLIDKIGTIKEMFR